jgi:predicted DsbA family dithiol-disulfide isomerase
MLIEVVADFSCPWCFIGRRRMARALAQRPHLPIETLWQPFQLHPELPAEGVDRRAALRSRFGDMDRVRAMEGVLEESGGKDGIRFAFDAIRRIPNTLNAHRLMRLARRAERDLALADRLFSAYFEAGLDLGDREVLIACAAEIGIQPEAARAFLTGDAETASVTAIDQMARQSGISGVPYFIFDRRYALAGAQEPASFLPLFDALAAIDDPIMASSL